MVFDTPTTNNSHPLAFQAIAHALLCLDSWEDRYRYIIRLGQALPRLVEDEKTDRCKIHGCASQVWLVSEIETHGGEHVITYRGESDASIVQGLIAILLALYSGRPAMEIVETDAIDLFDQMGFREHLTAQRSNGLLAMVNRIRADGEALTN